jgi:hypothetical protein
VPRPASSAEPGRPTPWRGIADTLALLRETAAVGLLALSATALWHATLPEDKAPNLVEPVVAALSYPRIFQRWGLFAPEPPKELVTVVVDAWNGRGLRFDPIVGGLPRETPAREPRPEGSMRPSPLRSAYFSNIGHASRAGYLDGLRDYVNRIGEERDPAERPTAWVASQLEAPIPPPEKASAPLEPSQITRRRLAAKP